MNYCIGDVHGCFDELMRMIRRIEERDSEARIFLLGDLLDRGPKSYEMLQWAMTHITPEGRYQSLMGNHEDLILQWYQYKYLPWLEGNPTAEELPPRSKFDFVQMAEANNLMDREKLEPIMTFLQGLPLHKKIKVTTVAGEVQQYVLAHAWYDAKVKLPVLQQKMNLRLREFRGNRDSSYIVVFGHTPTGKADFQDRCLPVKPFTPGHIAYLQGAINLDGGCCYGQEKGYHGHLCGICLETGEEFYEHR